jgi:hypothetical protein
MNKIPLKKQMYKLELFTWVHSPYIWQTSKRANAPDIVNRQLSAASERALASIELAVCGVLI